MTWSVVYLLLWVYRCFYSLAAEVIIARLTSLGDSGRYQDEKIESDLFGTLANAAQNPRQAATVFTEALGSLFNLIGGGSAVVTNIGFQTLATRHAATHAHADARLLHAAIIFPLVIGG